MGPKDILSASLDLTDNIVNAYLTDLSDADLLVRPVDGMNHIAWQLGHLIASEKHFIDKVKPGASPALPEGFDEGHGRKAHGVDDPSKYYSVAEYKRLWKAQRDVTRAVLKELSDTDLDQPVEGLPPFARNVAGAMLLCGNHALMHVGQFVAVRRKLGKPIAI